MRDVLLPLLLERVFHVTDSAYLEEIVRSGGLRPEPDAAFASAFGSRPNGFFRKRGCVSVFDYRDASAEILDESIMKCAPWMPAYSGRDFSMLFLSEAAYGQLVPWTRWKEEAAYSDMVVPHVEAGHPGGIALDLIAEMLSVTVEESSDPHLLALRRMRQAAQK